jgi:hypothetical protein
MTSGGMRNTPPVEGVCPSFAASAMAYIDPNSEPRPATNTAASNARRVKGGRKSGIVFMIALLPLLVFACLYPGSTIVRFRTSCSMCHKSYDHQCAHAWPR